MMAVRKDAGMPEQPRHEDASKHNQPTPRKNPGGVGLLAQVSTLAWNLVLPIVGGVLLGHYLDNRSGEGLTWTLSLLVLGVLIAFSNLYNLYVEHGREPLQNEMKQKQETHEEEKK